MRPPPLFQNYRGFSSFFRQIDLQDLYITLGSGLDTVQVSFPGILGTYEIIVGDTAAGFPSLEVYLPTSSLVGYAGGIILSTTNPIYGTGISALQLENPPPLRIISQQAAFPSP